MNYYERVFFRFLVYLCMASTPAHLLCSSLTRTNIFTPFNVPKLQVCPSFIKIWGDHFPERVSAKTNILWLTCNLLLHEAWTVKILKKLEKKNIQANPALFLDIFIQQEIGQ